MTYKITGNEGKVIYTDATVDMEIGALINPIHAHLFKDQAPWNGPDYMSLWIGMDNNDIPIGHRLSHMNTPIRIEVL